MNPINIQCTCMHHIGPVMLCYRVSLWKQESELDRDVREHYFGGSMNCKQ